MKTLWIEDEDALNVGRVIVTKTGTKDCVVCYSCDERAELTVEQNITQQKIIYGLKGDEYANSQ